MASTSKARKTQSALVRLQAFRNVRPLLRIVWQSSQSLAIASILLRVVASVLPVARLWLGKLILDQVVAVISRRSANTTRIWTFVGLELLSLVIGEAVSRTITAINELINERCFYRINILLMEHAAELDLKTLESPVVYDQLERSQRMIGSTSDIFAATCGMCQQVITLLAYAGAVAAISSWTVLALFCAVVPVFVLEVRFAQLGHNMLVKWTAQRREVDYFRYLGTSREGAKEIKIFGLGSYLVGRVTSLYERFYDDRKAVSIKRAFYGTCLTALPLAVQYTAFSFVLYRTIQGAVSIGSLTMFAAAFSSARGLIEGLFLSLAQLSERALVISDLFKFLRTVPQIKSAPNAHRCPRPIQHGLEFRDVSFSYPGSSTKILDHVNFCLRPTERIALVGENGAGKTTLVKLAARLYDPTEGTILLDGRDLRDYDVDDLQREIGIIFQDYVKYDMLAKENVGVGRIEALANRNRIVNAARKSLAEGIIESLPLKYEQMLGRRFQGGLDLSVGQWQAIALGRAYMRDAQVLILDEPTASLDARAETAVYERFAQVTEGKMAILISHRFSTVRIADRILFVSNGQIQEEGSHEKLISLGGQYAELFHMQAAGYK